MGETVNISQNYCFLPCGGDHMHITLNSLQVNDTSKEHYSVILNSNRLIVG